MSPPRGATGSTDLRPLVSYSLVAGLCNLIPIPLLDDWARDLLRKRQAMELAKGHGIALTGAEGKVLACGHNPPTVEGCARGCLLGALIQPIKLLFKVVFKKILRKVLFFLTIKDVIDTFSQTFHEGYLVDHALRQGFLSDPTGTFPLPPIPAEPTIPSAAGRPTQAPASAPPPTAPPAAPTVPPPPAPAAPGPGGPALRVIELRRVIEETCAEVDTRPIEKIARSSLRGSWLLLRRAGRAMGHRLKTLRQSGQEDERMIFERLERQGEEDLGGLIDQITASLAAQASYLTSLARHLDRRLADSAERMPPPTS